MTTNDIRTKYLEFLKNKGHVIVPSASLLPENDPTTLFTGSGMQPMVPYLLGQKHPAGTRLADSQKSFRSGDIEEVGDNRHTTFFEMLGNWSLGDYFKQEQIQWMWEFLTTELKLDPNRLYFTCFRGLESAGIPKDTESAELWQKLFASVGIVAKIGENSEVDGMIEGEKIFYFGEKKNWWSRSGTPDKMPVGEPGGPDTEMFWDFDPENVQKLHETSVWKDEPCHVNCDCGRFLEIGNNVFMQYRKIESGFELLPQKNVDFGGGLERIAAALNDDPDVFKIDLFDTIRSTIEQASGKTYGIDENETYAFRVVMDHLRAATFLISDGALPSNKDQGYFTRRLIRRAVHFGRSLNVTRSFCIDVTQAVIETYKDAYPDLAEKREKIIAEIQKEEEKFQKTVEKGQQELMKLLKQKKQIDGRDMFNLYQSYGYPKELTLEVAHSLSKMLNNNEKFTDHITVLVNEDLFDEELQKHQALSRAGAEQKFKGGLADTSEMSVKYHTATHLLHAALQKILGPQAVQKGSNITPERMRFDFAHSEKMTPEQIKAAEDLVNAAIVRDYQVSFQELPLEEAKKKQAIGLFEENYGTMVKVYTVGDPEGLAQADAAAPTFSRELCGGPHVEHTGTMGHFKIVKEEACSAGIRRIKAVLESV